jgi:hypothetical protein
MSPGSICDMVEPALKRGAQTKGNLMQSIQKMGGIGALIAAATFVIGLAMFATIFGDFVFAADSAAAVELIGDNQPALYAWNVTIMIVFGVALVPLVLAIRDRLDARSPLARVATVFGLIWSGAIIAAGMINNIAYGTVADLQATDPEMAATVWAGLDAVAKGLGGGNEILGGVWVLGLSIVALRARLFPRWTNYLGVIMGVAGLMTVIPPLEAVGAVFGLGLIAWFVAVGITLIKGHSQAPELPESSRV